MDRKPAGRRAALVALLITVVASLALGTERSAPPERGDELPRLSRRDHRATATTHSPAVLAQPVVAPAAVRVDGLEVADRVLLVRPRAGHSAALDAHLAELGAVTVDELPFLGVRRVVLSGETPLAEARARVSAFAEVEGVTYDPIARASGHGRGRSARSHALWSWRASGLDPRTGPRRAHASLVVAVLDSGVADTPGLRGVERVAPLDAIEGDAEPEDENGHGTFIANLLVGNPGLGGDAALMPVRVLDAELVGTESSLVLGLHHASMHGADVINLSLVFGAEYHPSQLLDAAVAEALSLGVVIVGAAGNDGQPFVRYPAAFPGVIAVGASTPEGPHRLMRAHYSSYGPALDLLAPGGDLDADRDRDGIPDGVIAETFDPDAPGRVGLWLYAGTSQAAAHASAAALRLLSEGVAPERVAFHLRERATEAPLPYARGFDLDSGAGELFVHGAAHVHGAVPSAGAEVIPVLYAHRAGAIAAIVDAGGAPIEGATVHARFSGALSMNDACVTDAAGRCVLAGGPLADRDVPAIVELQAVVLRDGRLVRPDTVATTEAVRAATSAIDGTGFGPSSILWELEPSFSTLFFPRARTTWVIFGSGAGSALPPTTVALDDAMASTLFDGSGTSGTGFGPSSLTWYGLTFRLSYSLRGFAYIDGTGFGPSSLVWTGWTFTYFDRAPRFGVSMVGSPLHDVLGATFGAPIGAGVARTEAP